MHVQTDYNKVQACLQIFCVEGTEVTLKKALGYGTKNGKCN